MHGDGLGDLVGRVLGEVEGDLDAAAERLMQLLGDGPLCIAALDRLADLAEEATHLAGRPDRAATLLRLRTAYRNGTSQP
jgi:hypothetical protein